MNKLLLRLTEDLKQFGLDPKEWNLEKLGTSVYLIRHRQDLQTYFWGLTKTTDQATIWQRLELVL